jgi:hypothetical protein
VVRTGKVHDLLGEHPDIVGASLREEAVEAHP